MHAVKRFKNRSTKLFHAELLSLTIVSHSFTMSFDSQYIPVSIWCQNDVSTSMRRHHVASTLIRRHFYVTCPQGLSILVQTFRFVKQI